MTDPTERPNRSDDEAVEWTEHSVQEGLGQRSTTGKKMRVQVNSA